MGRQGRIGADAMRHPRTAVAAMALSAAALVGMLLDKEEYAEVATIPTKNDRCTNGFGGTWNEDGSPVKCGDKIKPVPALKRTMAHINKDETALKRCITGPMSQVEFDIAVDFAYQYGTTATCNSSMVRHTNAGKYVEACNAYMLYKRSGGYDCSTMINGKPNKRCWGVWQRNLERRAKCIDAQS